VRTPKLKLTPENLAHLEEARKGNGLLHLELYCDNSDCMAREVNVKVKDYENELVDSARKRGFKCPMCGKQMKQHGVETPAQREARKEEWSRVSVNLQMRRRAQGEPGIFVITGTWFHDDRLPPTPDGWFADDDEKGSGQ
jgi:hypothetical protein